MKKNLIAEVLTELTDAPKASDMLQNHIKRDDLSNWANQRLDIIMQLMDESKSVYDIDAASREFGVQVAGDGGTNYVDTVECVPINIGATDTANLSVSRFTVNVNTAFGINAGSYSSANIGGKGTINIGKSYSTNVGGDFSINKGGYMSRNIGAKNSILIGDDVSINIGSEHSFFDIGRYAIAIGQPGCVYIGALGAKFVHVKDDEIFATAIVDDEQIFSKTLYTVIDDKFVPIKDATLFDILEQLLAAD